jgi:hypothetical protein
MNSHPLVSSLIFQKPIKNMGLEKRMSNLITDCIASFERCQIGDLKYDVIITITKKAPWFLLHPAVLEIENDGKVVNQRGTRWVFPFRHESGIFLAKSIHEYHFFSYTQIPLHLSRAKGRLFCDFFTKIKYEFEQGVDNIVKDLFHNYPTASYNCDRFYDRLFYYQG